MSFIFLHYIGNLFAEIKTFYDPVFNHFTWSKEWNLECSNHIWNILCLSKLSDLWLPQKRQGYLKWYFETGIFTQRGALRATGRAIWNRPRQRSALQRARASQMSLWETIRGLRPHPPLDAHISLQAGPLYLLCTAINATAIMAARFQF